MQWLGLCRPALPEAKAELLCESVVFPFEYLFLLLVIKMVLSNEAQFKAITSLVDFVLICLVCGE